MGNRTQLNRALSKLGICSRTDAGKLIYQGIVTVNGTAVHDPLTWVDLESDRIEVRQTIASKVPPPAPMTTGPFYAAMHKPRGYVTTFRDELSRKTVYDLLPTEWSDRWLFPVGRLDRDSEGLLFMTSDGDWANRLTDPDSHVPKTYRVELNHMPDKEDLAALRNGGLILDGHPLLPAAIEAEQHRWFNVTINEGRNRQIRRMFHSCGCKVVRLIRTAIGPIRLEGLDRGAFRLLTAAEVAQF